MDEYTKDLYTMMFSLQTLQNQGITIRETVYKSLDKLLLWNKESENSKYLELALLICRLMLIWDLLQMKKIRQYVRY